MFIEKARSKDQVAREEDFYLNTTLLHPVFLAKARICEIFKTKFDETCGK
jgi:hypothetical protein